MRRVVKATVQGNYLKPHTAIGLPQGTTVRLTIEPERVTRHARRPGAAYRPRFDRPDRPPSRQLPEQPFRREIARDPWGMMHRVYGLRHSLLWPGQFAMLDLFKFATAWCLIVSLLAVIVRWLSP